MILGFTAKTNKDYVMINSATFKSTSGKVLIIDRDTTEYDNEEGNLEMIWRDCYIWAIDDNYEEEPLYLNYEEFHSLLDGAELISLNLEDDADDDYEVFEISWYIY